MHSSVEVLISSSTRLGMDAEIVICPSWCVGEGVCECAWGGCVHVYGGGYEHVCFGEGVSTVCGRECV